MAHGHWQEVGRLDEVARLDSPIHRLDARAKALATLAFIVTVVSFPRYEISALTPLAVYPLTLAVLGRLPARLLLRKLAVALPFALFIGLFNPLLDRQPMAVLGPLVLSGGWLSFGSILLRFALTVGAALVLLACTGLHRLVAGLDQLGLPRVFAVQLLFLYRYLFVIGDEGTRMLRSAALRSADGRGLRAAEYGPLAGHLLLRSLDRAERVYHAMQARGFAGEVRTLQPARLRAADLLFLAGWLAFFAAARMWNLAAGLGGWLTGGPP